MSSISKKVTSLIRQLSFSSNVDDASESSSISEKRRKNQVFRSKSGGHIPSKSKSDESQKKKHSTSDKNNKNPSCCHAGVGSCFLCSYLSSDQSRPDQPVITYGKTGEDLPRLKIAHLKSRIVATQTGPDKGIESVNPVNSHFTSKEPDISFIDLDKDTDTSTVTNKMGGFKTDQNENHDLFQRTLKDDGFVGGIENWTCPSERAYGIAVSLYEVNPVTSLQSGDPIADSFAVLARENNAILAVADGVNWGEKAKLAARCAVYASVHYLNRILFENGLRKLTTSDLFTSLLQSFDAAHRLILLEEAALTTLACCIVAPLDRSGEYVACICNVGDSLAYVYNRKTGVREITKGSHNIDSARDMRDALGALGPVDGQNPELSNLTCSMTIVEKDDIIFMTSDGISDNLDPVVGKFASADKKEESDKAKSGSFSLKRDKLGSSLKSVSPLQRHDLTSRRIEDILNNGIDGSGESCKTAKQLCEILIEFVQRLTSAKRNVLEDKDLYYDAENKLLDAKEHRNRRKQICQRINMMPGKLDHACVVAYSVGDVSCSAKHNIVPSPKARKIPEQVFPILELAGSNSTIYDNLTDLSLDNAVGPAPIKCESTIPVKEEIVKKTVLSTSCVQVPKDIRYKNALRGKESTPASKSGAQENKSLIVMGGRTEKSCKRSENNLSDKLQLSTAKASSGKDACNGIPSPVSLDYKIQRSEFAFASGPAASGSDESHSEIHCSKTKKEHLLDNMDAKELEAINQAQSQDKNKDTVLRGKSCLPAEVQSSIDDLVTKSSMKPTINELSSKAKNTPVGVLGIHPQVELEQESLLSRLSAQFWNSDATVNSVNVIAPLGVSSQNSCNSDGYSNTKETTV